MTDSNEINKTYNELTIVGFIDKPKIDKYKSWNTSKWVLCECSCGNPELIQAPLYGVKNGYIKSCGHLRKEQAIIGLNENRNSTHNAIQLTFNEETHNISEWSRITGIPRTTIMYRLSKEMPIENVLERKNNEENISGTRCN